MMRMSDVSLFLKILAVILFVSYTIPWVIIHTLYVYTCCLNDFVLYICCYICIYREFESTYTCVQSQELAILIAHMESSAESSSESSAESVPSPGSTVRQLIEYFGRPRNFIQSNSDTYDLDRTVECCKATRFN